MRKHRLSGTLRATACIAFSIALAMGGVPAPALAEAIEEAPFIESDKSTGSEDDVLIAVDEMSTQSDKATDAVVGNASEGTNVSGNKIVATDDGEESPSAIVGVPDAAQTSAQVALQTTDVDEGVELSTQATSYSGTCGTCNWVIDSTGKLAIYPSNGADEGTLDDWTSSDSGDAPMAAPWIDYASSIKSCVFSRTIHATTCYRMFHNCRNLTSFDGAKLDTSSVTTMQDMFYNCNKLKTANVAGWVTSQVQDMRAMFYDCYSLTSLDISAWKTPQLVEVASMFSGCSGLSTLNAAGWDTSGVKNMTYMFKSCSGIKSINASGWNTSNVTNMKDMFYYCHALAELDATGWDVSGCTNAGSLFSDCSKLSTVTLSSESLFDVLPTPSTTAPYDGTWSPSAFAPGTNTYEWNTAGRLSSLSFAGQMGATEVSVADLTYAITVPYNVDPATAVLTFDAGDYEVYATNPSEAGASPLVSGNTLSTLEVGKPHTLYMKDKTSNKVTEWTLNVSQLFPSVSFSPESTLRLPDVTYGYSTPSSATFTITNMGAFDLTNVKLTLAGTSPDAFTLSKTNIGNLSKDATCDVTVSSKADLGKGFYKATIEVTADQPLSTTLDLQLGVARASLSGAKVTVASNECTYNGSAHTPAVTSVVLGGKTLTADTDYTVSYSNNTNVGTATVTVTGVNTGNYTGSTSATFTISAAVIAVPKAAANLTYDGTEQAGVAAGAGYTLSGTCKAKDAGSYVATATPDANHCWADGTTVAKEIPWSIARKPVTVTANDAGKAYDEADPALAATVDGVVDDYAIKYSLSRAAGEAIGAYPITPAGEAVQGNYNVTCVGGTFTIKAVNLAKGTVTLPATSYTYTGKTISPVPTVKIEGKTLSRETDYKVSYKNNANAGTATVTVTGTGNYAGTKSATFTINKAANPMTAKGKQATVTTTFNAGKAVVVGINVAVDKVQGKLVFSNASTNATAKKFKLNAITGEVTVPAKTNVGTYTVVVRTTAGGGTNYSVASKDVTYKIVVAKAMNTLTVKAVTKTAKLSVVKKKAVTVPRPMSVANAKGALSFKKAGGDKRLTVNANTGKVTVRRGTNKGAYKVKIKVTAKGDKNYKAGSRTVTCKVIVK